MVKHQECEVVVAEVLVEGEGVGMVAVVVVT
jgi:hypothetical protein